MDAVVEHAEIEFVILANHVEAVNGLLYVSGGGWSEHNRTVQPNSPPPASHFGVGVSIRIPWHATNAPHRLTFRVESVDGEGAAAPVAQFDTSISVGRPHTVEPGSAQHAVLGVTVDTVFPRAGRYHVRVALDENAEEHDVKLWPFRVHDIPRGLRP